MDRLNRGVGPGEGYRSGRGGEAASDDDTEGHRMLTRATGDEDDTEGHRMLTRATGDEEDDTEGHGVPYPRATGDEEDDTEGHGVPYPR